MHYLRPPKRFPAPENMDNKETATWIGWIHQETHAVLEELNEEVRLQSDKDDPFTKDIVYATGSHHTNEILPDKHTQQLEEKLTSPLSIKKANIPLPQWVNNRRSEILPVNKEFKDTRGKPPVYNTRSNNTKCQINYDNVPWEGNDTSYLQLPNTRQQTVLEQFSTNNTTDIRLCHRCRGGGHIRKYCNANVHCDFCKSYSHNTSVCRSYPNFVRAHPMASSRRASPAQASRQTEWTQPTVEVERVDIAKQQKCEETFGENDAGVRRDISEITQKHLERVISAMIPSSTCSSSDPAERFPMNSIVTQPGDKETEKQVIVNNYYISDKEEGWKQVKVSKISPDSSRNYTQNRLSEIVPNKGMMENPNNQFTTVSEESLVHPKENTGVRLQVRLNTQVMKDPKRYHTEEAEVQNTAPPTTENHSHPPPMRQGENLKTTVMLDCIRQLQLTLQQHILTNSKQSKYQMSQNADLFSEMIKGQNRRDLDPTVMAIPTFTGEEPEKCLDWINRIKNICSQAGWLL